jgi:hypothetical protein
MQYPNLDDLIFIINYEFVWAFKQVNLAHIPKDSTTEIAMDY